VPDLLSAAVRATAAATGADDLLDRVAQLLVPYADWVVVDRLDDPDLVTRVAAYDATGPLTLAQGRGPRAGPSLLGRIRRPAPGADGRPGPGAAARSSGAVGSGRRA